jgi:dipeptide/tripeptide permease
MLTLDEQVGKPVSAKIADVLGRAEAWAIGVLLYTVGYIVLASCTSSSFTFTRKLALRT